MITSHSNELVIVQDASAPCAMCGVDDIPRAALYPAGQAPITLCLFCLGRGAEAATGWKIVKMLAQWLVNAEAVKMARAHEFWSRMEETNAEREETDNG